MSSAVSYQWRCISDRQELVDYCVPSHALSPKNYHCAHCFGAISQNPITYIPHELFSHRVWVCDQVTRRSAVFHRATETKSLPYHEICMLEWLFYLEKQGERINTDWSPQDCFSIHFNKFVEHYDIFFSEPFSEFFKFAVSLVQRTSKELDANPRRNAPDDVFDESGPLCKANRTSSEPSDVNLEFDTEMTSESASIVESAPNGLSRSQRFTDPRHYEIREMCETAEAVLSLVERDHQSPDYATSRRAFESVLHLREILSDYSLLDTYWRQLSNLGLVTDLASCKNIIDHLPRLSFIGLGNLVSQIELSPLGQLCRP